MCQYVVKTASKVMLFLIIFVLFSSANIYSEFMIKTKTYLPTERAQFCSCFPRLFW